jgi:hypothetical protein
VNFMVTNDNSSYQRYAVAATAPMSNLRLPRERCFSASLGSGFFVRLPTVYRQYLLYSDSGRAYVIGRFSRVAINQSSSFGFCGAIHSYCTVGGQRGTQSLKD